MNTDNVLKAGQQARERSETAANWAMDAGKTNGWAYVGKGAVPSEAVRHADHMEPPLQARDGWHALAIIFWAWLGVFVAAPFFFGFGGALAQVYLRGLV